MRPWSRSLSLLSLAAVLFTAGCATDMPTAPVDPPSESLLGNLLSKTGLLRCSPQPYAAATATIGPSGGVLEVGPHTLYVPPGALDGPVTITAVAPSDTVNFVRFEPHGLEFNRPAYLTMSYANCNLLGRLLPKRIAYTNDLFTILEYLLSLDNLWTRRVTGRVEHFSGYAIAW